MNVANLDLCRELYELSGWTDNDHHRYLGEGEEIPAYDLGYLLRKLQPFNAADLQWLGGKWAAQAVIFGTQPKSERTEADTPEDAACKLAIELFKQGVLTK